MKTLNDMLRAVCVLGAAATLGLGAAGPRKAAPAAPRPLAEARIQALEARSRKLGGAVLLVWERGQLRAGGDLDPETRATPRNLMSGAKNFWALACLQAAEDGLLDLDEPASAALPEWAGDPDKRAIRLRHLLQCSAGLEPAMRELQGPTHDDKYGAVLGVPSFAAPGAAFAYGPSSYLALAEVLRRRLAPRGETPAAYLQRRLMGPLGLDLATWRSDPAGNLMPYAGLSLTPDQWLAFGRMLLDRGRWASQELLPPGALARALAPGPANPAYGMSFWLNGAARAAGAQEADVERWIADRPGKHNWRRACLSRSAPPDLYACIGSYGQRLYVVPSRQLVIVHLGHCRRFVDGPFLKVLFGAQAPRNRRSRR
ncbi:MAG TPA: serine hydrolase [Holophaga sp.]|nr:serine hydrolase [Holophaga sp.]